MSILVILKSEQDGKEYPILFILLYFIFFFFL